MLAVACVFKLFPPKRINPFYGYRTHRSMKNSETWRQANRMSSTIMLISQLGILSITLFSRLIFPAIHTARLIIFLTLLVASIVLNIVLTERHLKRVSTES
ncbi:SdpI family protein [Arcticibacter sp. MXS-1]|uniref:SdpI family protein n=1 Tax=Arcticibacter sp. MXS-1 TaxID=3341726 RepID=UPI0035A828AD